jgi:hypothetical protein
VLGAEALHYIKDTICTYKISVRNSEADMLGGLGLATKSAIKCERSEDWLHLAQDSGQCRAVVYAVMNLDLTR